MRNFTSELNILKEKSVFRYIKDIQKKEGKYIFLNNKKMLNLSSNDYLNIGANVDLKNEFIEKYKNHCDFFFSSASARLLSGSSESYCELEKIFAKLFNKEKSLIFNTGFQCNQSVISALAKKSDCIFSDKLNHASIVAGLKLSPAEHFRYKHLDYDNLEKLLKEKRKNYNNIFIISESVFSMDGDVANIEKLVELKKKYDCYLMLDEAHAFGVFGENIAGVAQERKLLNEIDIITITLGKALGSMGAVCIAETEIIEYLVNKATGFIFSTAIAPVNILWTKFLLEDKFSFLLQQKEKLNDLIKFAHKVYPTISSSQIIPIIIGGEEKTRQIADFVQNDGFFALPINPPTVPVNTSRLRISLTSDIEKSEFLDFIKKLEAKNAELLVK